MPIFKKLSYCLKYPLMWVMLLWALTAPGQEEVVYRFLVEGLADKTLQHPVAGKSEFSTAASQHRSMQKCWDAKVNQDKLLHHMQVPGCRPKESLPVLPGKEQSPHSHITFVRAFTKPQFLLNTILPNAP